MKLLAPLLLLPYLASAQTNLGLSQACANFELIIEGVTFIWKNPSPNGSARRIVIDPDHDTMTNSIRWGKPGSLGKSGLIVSTAGSDIPADGDINVGPNQQFKLGEMTHVNHPIYANTQIEYVELCIVLHTANHGDFPFDYNLDIHETYNVADITQCPYESTTPCADRVLFLNDPSPHEILTVDGMRFELDLIGFRDTAFSPIKTNFTSQERGMTTAGLWGSLFLTDCPGGGGSMGDPHFQTWTGHWYDFQGACDLHLVTAPEFAPNAPLTIDVRTKTKDWFSYIETAAIQIGEDILEVTGYGDYSFNSVEGADLPVKMANQFTLYEKKISKKTHELIIDLENGERIVVHTFKEFVSVKIQNAHRDRFVNSGGMMGDFRTGEVYTRDRTNILVDPEEIAREWQVRDTEPILFESVLGAQYPERCSMPTMKQHGGLRKQVSEKEAKTACARHSGERKQFCIRDVMKTGDLEMAEAEVF